jgi:hypothetical protein|tara:strand:- start:383 stop:679 length:297 start_codon:yes stop_codon:yes gene_type:complete
MKYKSKAIELMNKHNIEYCPDGKYTYETCLFTNIRTKILYIDIDAPYGYRFEPELHSLVCEGWQDAYYRVLGYLDDEHGLEKCDNKCGEHYECWRNEE